LLAEMGTSLPASVEIREWDSSAEIGYFVLPNAQRAPKDSARISSPRPNHPRLDDRSRATVNRVRVPDEVAYSGSLIGVGQASSPTSTGT